VPLELYYSGQAADVHVYTNSRGDALAADFIESLPKGDQIKIIRLIQLFADNGDIRNPQKFRLEENPIYALKSFQVRILCFFLPKQQRKTLVLTHGFVKKSYKLPKSELDKARQIRQEVLSHRSS